MILNNPCYSDPEKLQFLTQLLKGEAAKIVTDTNKSNLSYPEAWRMVWK